MSRDRIKIGRYSKERRHQAQIELLKIKKNQLMIPFLPKYSDAQDIMIRCNQSFSNFFVENLSHEIKDFEKIFEAGKCFLKQGLFDREKYMDFYEIAGFELDDRRIFHNLSELVLLISLKKFFRAIRELPGLNEVPKKDFYEIILKNRMDYFIMLIAISGNHWNGDELIMRYDKTHTMILKKQDLEFFTDKYYANLQKEFDDRISEVELTYEETTFLIAINMLKHAQRHSNFKLIHTRFILSFTRYLECKYSRDYHLRLREIINLQAYLNEKMFKMKKWLNKNQNYLKCMYSQSVVKAFFAIQDLNEAIKLLEKFHF